MLKKDIIRRVSAPGRPDIEADIGVGVAVSVRAGVEYVGLTMVPGSGVEPLLLEGEGA
jgi:hypothetical protein